jgi:hypothetical protein
VRAVSIFSQEVPPFGTAWGGCCAWAGGGWTSGPATSAEDDLRIARMIVAGLAGEVITRRESQRRRLLARTRLERGADHPER